MFNIYTQYGYVNIGIRFVHWAGTSDNHSDEYDGNYVCKLTINYGLAWSALIFSVAIPGELPCATKNKIGGNYEDGALPDWKI